MRFAKFYLLSWWLPTLVHLLLLGVAAGSFLIPGLQFVAWAFWVVLALPILGLVGVLVSCVTSFVQKRLLPGFVNLLALPVLLVVSIYGLVVVAFISAFAGPSEDNFSKNLVIPPGIEIAEPLPEIDPTPGPKGLDTFQDALLPLVETTSDSGDTTVQAEIPELLALHAGHRDLLVRYLSAHPGWRVYRERGELYATRRWRIGEFWSFGLHGYYSHNDLDRFSSKPQFQFRLNLGLDGKYWAGKRRETTVLKPGATAKLELHTGNTPNVSTLGIEAPGLVVEVFEESLRRERHLTKAALAELRRELAPLAASPTWETAKSLLPSGSIGTGAPRFDLHNGFQGGIYDSQVRVNPGEPGTIYFKAFEVTKGTQLSRQELERYGAERVGWSDNPDELFFSNTHFTIGEGDWENYYAARFELWFKPDSGKPERKLLEKVYKIEGWQR